MPSDKNTALQKAKDDADEDFDYSDGILTLVDVDFGGIQKTDAKQSCKEELRPG